MNISELAHHFFGHDEGKKVLNRFAIKLIVVSLLGTIFSHRILLYVH